jgi:TRAP-type C4-dicarboxylate transport system substrate-binding protein
MDVSKGITCLLFSFLAACGAATQSRLPFVVSVENVRAHFQAKASREFADKLAGRSEGRLEVRYYDGASLYRDAEVVKALAMGEVACAFPGLWQLDGMVPDTATFMLPSVYGRSVVQMRALADGPLGDWVSRRVEEVLGVVVIGPWLDLGYGQLFGARLEIRGIRDIAGKRIRVAGGRGNEERIKAFGAYPVFIPSSDLPAYLKGGLLDGVLSTYETIDSAALDKHGIRSVLEDREYYPFYLPLVSRSAWDAMSPALRETMASCWREIVLRFREEAVAAQAQAKARLVARGLAVHAPSEGELALSRDLLLAKEEEIAARLSVSEEALALLEGSFDGKEGR